MALTDQVPQVSSFNDLLSVLTGDDSSGLSGLLTILQANDFSDMSVGFLSGLSGLLGVELPENTNELIQVPLNTLPQLLSSIPSGPGDITDGMLQGLEGLEQIFTNDVIGGFDQLVNKLIDIEKLIGKTPDELVPFVPTSILNDTNITILKFLSIVKEKANVLSDGFLDVGDGDYDVETWFTSYAYSFISGIEAYFGRGVSQLFETYQLLCQDLLDVTAVRQIHTLRDNTSSQYSGIKAQVEAGETDILEQLQRAQNNLYYLRNHLSIRVASVQTKLDQDGINIDTFKANLEEEYNNVLNNALLEMVGLRERINNLFEDIATQVEAINLDEISNTIEGVFNTINGFIAELNLEQFRESVLAPLNTVRDTVQGVNDQVLYVVVDMTNLLTEFRDTLQGLAEEVGSFDNDGQFHYTLESDLNELFNQLDSNLNDTVRPAIQQFGDETLNGVFTQLNSIMTPATDAIEGVRNDLASLLQNFLDLLGTLNITESLETIQSKLDEVLDKLAPVEFDPVTTPVIEEIDSMKEQLQQIDVSSLSELTRGALSVSVDVLTAIDFDGQIKDLLMQAMDGIIDYPKEAMEELVEQVELVKNKLDAVSPNMVLTPLSELYKPVRTSLEAISINEIAEPLSDWHASIQSQINRLAPAQMLQPLIDIHLEVQTGLSRFNATQLIEPIQTALNQAVAYFNELDISGLVTPLTERIETLQQNIVNLNPSNLLDPLIQGFDAINEQMAQYNPAVLLAPIDAIIDRVLDRVNDLSNDLLTILQDALVSFSGRIDRISPSHIFDRLNSDCDYVHGLLEQLNPQQMVADLHGSYQELKTAYQNAGIGNTETDDLIEALNPITVISAINPDYQALEESWQTWRSGFGEGDLGALHETLRPKLESFLPLADAGELTLDFIKTFLQENKPSSFLGGLTTLYETLQEQLGALDPQQIKDNLQGSFEAIDNVFAQLDISGIVQEVEALFDDIKNIVNAIDLQVVVDELDGLMSDVQSVLAGLDPSVLIAPLEELWNNVVAVLGEVNPQTLLAPLSEVIDPIKEGILAFDPATFAESLNQIFDEIKRIIDEIDVRIVLQPLMDKLDELRNELDEEVTKVGSSFEAMVRAVPV